MQSCAGKISLEEINSEKDKKENIDDSNEDELTYSSDQPRAPKGQSNGGQWVSKDGGSGGGNSQDKNEKRSPYEHPEALKNPKMKKQIEEGRYFTYNEAKKLVSDLLDLMERDIGNGKGVLNSDASKELLLGTAVTESELIPRDQDSGGPAKGLMQMEKVTFDDIWSRYLESDLKFPGSDMTRRQVKEWIKDIATPDGSEITHKNLNDNDDLAVIMARINYLRIKTPLPSAGNLKAQSEYYAKYYYGGEKQENRGKKYVDNNNRFLSKSKR